MSIAYSAAASLYRSTNKDRMEIKKIGFRSDGNEEFASAYDYNNFCKLVNKFVEITEGVGK